jgi:hypothetical protein
MLSRSLLCVSSLMAGKLPFVVFMSRSKVGWVPSMYTLPPVCKFCDGDLCVGNNRVSHYQYLAGMRSWSRGEKSMKPMQRTKISAVRPLIWDAHVLKRCMLYMSPSNASGRTSVVLRGEKKLVFKVTERMESSRGHSVIFIDTSPWGSDALSITVVSLLENGMFFYGYNFHYFLIWIMK